MLQHEIDQVEIVERNLLISAENLREKGEHVMMLEGKVADLREQIGAIKDQHSSEKSQLQKELDDLRTKESNSTAHANYLQNMIGEIEHEFQNVDYINEPSIVGKIQYLLENESKYSEAAQNHEEKESAFREVLQLAMNKCFSPAITEKFKGLLVVF